MPKSVVEREANGGVRAAGAPRALAGAYAGPGLALLFLGVVGIAAGFTVSPGPLSLYVIAACVIGAYMALNIGANDVANNMGPSVGSRALTMGGALLIAGLCEAAGAILAGGDVVATVSRRILSPGLDISPFEFILVMMAALLAGAMWIHLATVLRAPVSTTHSVIGGVLGAGVAAGGLGIVQWATVAAIVASWVVSPVLGGMIAAGLLGFVEWMILFRRDRIEAARRWVPVLIGLMSGVFAMYLSLKGFSRVWRPSAEIVLLLGVLFFAGGWLATRPWVMARADLIENRRAQISRLFNLPLVFAAGLLSFAHGANDVANAVGPLAAIVAVAETGLAAPPEVTLPLWVLVVGGVGIAVGLALFGPRLIRRVGEEITKMDAIRAFCVALSAAITVLLASALGMPISSTHTAIGAVFGVGFLREALTNWGVPTPAVQARSFFIDPAALNKTPEEAIANYRARERRQLVRRHHVLVIVTAWIVTVPVAGLLAGLIYLALRMVGAASAG